MSSTEKSSDGIRKTEKALDLAKDHAIDSRKGHFLVVDDDEWNRDLLAQSLEIEGHTCVLAAGGPQALDLIERERFEVVLLDVAMPEMSGLEVLEIVRRTHSLTELPVIMVTAREGSDHIAQALRLGANDYVNKPIDMVVLMARVQTQILTTRLERSLKAEKQFSENVINSAHEMIISVNLDRRIILFNKASEENFGYSRNEVIGQHVDFLYADPKEGMQVHKTSLRNNGFTGEIRNRRKDGAEFDSALSVSVLNDSAGNPMGVMGISTDITEKKRLEAEKENLSRLKDEFLRIASHDLKNPVAAIYGLARVIQEFVPPGAVMSEESHDFLDQIVRNAGLMERIVGDFLDFHALEDGKLILHREPVDLNRIAGEVININTEYASSKGVSLSFYPSAQIPQASADPIRIHQVIQNLLGNAIKFGSEGTKVTASTRIMDGSVVFEVKDTGPGIPENELPEVFKKYTQLTNKPTGGESSSGLGLAISKQLIGLHSGEIGVQNNPEGGALFWFSMPV